MDERATRDGPGHGVVTERRLQRRRTIDRPSDEAGPELMPGELAEVLRDVADRLDAVLDDRRATSGSSRGRLEGTEGAVEAWSSVVARDGGRVDSDLRRAALETTVLRIGPDGSLLERRARDRRASDRREGDRDEAAWHADERRTGERRAHERGATSDVTTQPTPDPVTPARPDVDERLREARRQLVARRTAAEAKAQVEADGSWRRGAAMAVVRNVGIGVAIGVVIALARVLLT